jgi:hypothetical protein
LAPIIERDGEPYIYRTNRDWIVFCEAVPPGERLPKILGDTQIEELAREFAAFHDLSIETSKNLDPTWKTLGSDVASLFDRLGDPHWREERQLYRNDVALIERHCESFFRNAERVGYHQLARAPVLIDWNISNFSIQTEKEIGFSLLHRWDYDWFRMEPRMMDFYFFSRVVRQEGDTSRFSYTPDMFTEPRFLRFLAAYHEASPISESEILFLREAYRFFILIYVLNLGEHFFQWSLRMRLQREAIEQYLPAADALDLAPLLAVVR